MKEKCFNHPDIDSLSLCHSCERYFCKDCLVEGAQYYYCKDEECQNALENDLLPEETVPQVRPWLRFYVRLSEYWVCRQFVHVILADFGISTENLFELKRISFPWVLFLESYIDFDFLIAIALWTLVEPILLSTWGYTPFKWCFRIKVRDTSGKKLSIFKAFIRVIPISILFVLGMQSFLLFVTVFLILLWNFDKNGITLWDRIGGFVVSHEKIRTGRVILTFLFILILYILIEMNVFF